MITFTTAGAAKHCGGLAGGEPGRHVELPAATGHEARTSAVLGWAGLGHPLKQLDTNKDSHIDVHKLQQGLFPSWA